MPVEVEAEGEVVAVAVGNKVPHCIDSSTGLNCNGTRYIIGLAIKAFINRGGIKPCLATELQRSFRDYRKPKKRES